jgi:hypothetical protein
MKTTIDLPDELLHRAQEVAARRLTTVEALVRIGLDRVLRSDDVDLNDRSALDRLQTGLALGGQSLPRETAHERD